MQRNHPCSHSVTREVFVNIISAGYSPERAGVARLAISASQQVMILLGIKRPAIGIN